MGFDEFMGNTGSALRNPIPAFNFVLEVEALYFMALKSVKVFNKENEYEYIREGGVNDYVHMRRKPISKPFTFQVERYVGAERFLDPLANGTELVAPVLLYVYRYQPRQGITESAPASPARVYTFTGCVVTAKEYGELNSEKSGLLTETTTIAYRELVVVTNPSADSQEKPTFDKFEDLVNPANKTNEKKYATLTNFTSDQFYKQEVVEGRAEGRAIWVRNSDQGANPQFVKPPKTYQELKDSAADIAMNSVWANEDNLYVNEGYYTKVPDEDGVSRLIRKSDGSATDLAKPPRKYEEYVTKPLPEYANDTNAKAGYQTYTTETDKDGVKHVIRTDEGSQYNKKAKTYEDYAADTTPAWANKRNTEADTSLYTLTPDKDGIKHIVRRPDGEKYTKPARGVKDYKDDTAAKWGANSPVDKPLAEPKGPWNIKDPDADKFAEQSPVDQPLAEPKGPWSIKDPNANKFAEQSPKDSSKPKKKGPWSIKSPDANKSAAQSPKDSSRPDAKPVWDINSPDANKNAAQSPQDSSTPQSKGVWSIKSPEASRSSVSPATDSSKPEAKGPWDIKQNTTNPKPSFATESPTDHEKPEAVTWPPTRRALMAQALSENKK